MNNTVDRQKSSDRQILASRQKSLAPIADGQKSCRQKKSLVEKIIVYKSLAKNTHSPFQL